MKYVYTRELYHHGIKGQKWGVRRYQYEDGTWTEEGKRRRRVGDGRGRSGFVDPALATYITVNLALIGIAAAKAHAFNKDQKREYPPLNEKDVPRITHSHTEEDDSTSINSDAYKRGEKGATMNCVNCSTAYELRRRGYDVKARLNKFGKYNETVEKYFNGAKLKVITAATREPDNPIAAVRNALSSEPVGSRGNLLMQFRLANIGHSVVYENTKNGLVIRDTQSDKTYRGEEIDKFFALAGGISAVGSRYARTDNVEVNWDKISEAIVDYSETDKKKLG